LCIQSRQQGLFSTLLHLEISRIGLRALSRSNHFTYFASLPIKTAIVLAKSWLRGPARRLSDFPSTNPTHTSVESFHARVPVAYRRMIAKVIALSNSHSVFNRALRRVRQKDSMVTDNFEIRWTANRQAFANCYPGPPVGFCAPRRFRRVRLRASGAGTRRMTRVHSAVAGARTRRVRRMVAPLRLWNRATASDFLDPMPAPRSVAN
jgi:hypothetical protein